MSTAKVTVVAVQRERFGTTRRSLENLYATAGLPFELVYVDTGSPRRVQRYLARRSRELDFRLLRTDRFLSPNAARNLGFTEVRTPYVAFLDNDVEGEPGWLRRLVACAEETGAWAVAPLYLMGELADGIVHMAGGAAHFREEGGARRYVEQHFHIKRPLSEVRPGLMRRPVEMVEFHAVLLRADALRRLGPLDEGLLSQFDHADLSLTMRAAGGKLYFEPDSMVTYRAPRLLSPGEFRFYLLRWSDAWNEASLSRFRTKHNLAADDEGTRIAADWCRSHRRDPFRRLLKPVRLVLGRKAVETAIDGLERLLSAAEDGPNPLRGVKIREVAR